MASIFKPIYNKIDPKTGKKVARRLRKWYVRYQDVDGMKTVVGYTDKAATTQMAARLERDAARRKEGVISPHESQQKRPINEHLEEFGRYLAAKGNGQEHVAKTIANVRRILDACRINKITDLQPSSVVEFLADLRRSATINLPNQTVASFNVKETAGLLRVTPDSVHRMIKRGILRCDGTGRRKRFARDEVERAMRDRSKGISIETSNHYLVSIKEFTRWLVRDQRASIDPLVHLSRLNANVDVRRSRRALTEDVFNRFVEATGSGRPYHGLSGADRLVLYLFASHTGFRANELASLEPASFEFDADPPTVVVKAAYSKHRREDTQPLRPDVANLMKAYIAGKPAHARLWPGTWVKSAAEMLRHDLEAAGIPYQDDDGRYFDFHALRGQFISFLAAKGVHPKVAQVLARHSTITLTMDYYTHLDVLDVSGALDNLPGIPNMVKQAGKKTAG